MRPILPLLFLILCAPLAVSAERITLFESTISVNQSGEVRIIERIDYDFENAERRGIFRIVPQQHTRGGVSVRTPVRAIAVHSLEGATLPFEVEQNARAVRIRIGDPNVTVTGLQTYVISYTVDNALLYLSQYDELYWNVTGTEWTEPIDIVRAQVLLDFPNARLLQASCYRGERAATRPCSAEDVGSARYEILQEGVPPRSGVTIAVGFPKGLVAQTELAYSLYEQVARNAGLPLALFILMWCGYAWYTRGRDTHNKGIVRQFSPPAGLSPAEAGVVVDGIAHTKDIIAQVIELARAGFLKIHQYEKKSFIHTSIEYILEPLHESDALLYSYDRHILSALFPDAKKVNEDIGGKRIEGVILSSLAHTLADEFSSIKHELYETVAARGFFVKNPQSIRTRWCIAALLFGAACGALLAAVPLLASVQNIASLSVASLVIALTGLVMPARTHEGARLKAHILALKEYLHVAEKDRLAFHNAPAKTPEEFDALLPYAIVLGVEKQWAAQFGDVVTTPPEWFVPASGHAFSAAFFVADVSGFMSGLARADTTAPSASSGGGSVGGGAGGGGGGSW